jgi:acyl carrier protein
MADVNSVLQQLDQFVRTKFEIAPDDPDFGSDVHLFDYGYVDSFGAQAIIEFVEATFQIKITDDDLIKYPLNTLNEISQFVIKRQASRA